MKNKIIPKRLRPHRIWICREAQRQFGSELDKQDIASLFGITLSHYTKILKQKTTWRKK